MNILLVLEITLYSLYFVLYFSYMIEYTALCVLVIVTGIAYLIIGTYLQIRNKFKS